MRARACARGRARGLRPSEVRCGGDARCPGSPNGDRGEAGGGRRPQPQLWGGCRAQLPLGTSPPPLPFFPFSLEEWVLSRLPFIFIITVIILDLNLGPFPVGRASSPPPLCSLRRWGRGVPVLPLPPMPPSPSSPPRVRVRACARMAGL